MLKKRIIGVITVKNHIAVQSVAYKKYLPIGSPLIAAKNLDLWGIDEILLNCIDANTQGNPNFKILEQIKDYNITSPLIYGGGIESVKDAERIIKHGADRILIENAGYKKNNLIKNLQISLGSQALILSLSLIYEKNKIYQYNYLKKNKFKINNNFKKIISKKLISEIMISDVHNDGSINGFNENIINNFDNNGIKLICFGGITTPNLINRILNKKDVSAVAIGNSLNYHESKIYNLKKDLKLVRK